MSIVHALPRFSDVAPKAPPRLFLPIAGLTSGVAVDVCRPAAKSRTPVIAKGGLTPLQLKRVARFIEENFVETIQVRDLASVSNLSRGYFSRAFTKSVGWPPHHMLNRYRVIRAAWLMAVSNETLADIAIACGLCDQAHLTRLFRKFVGASPARWRGTADCSQWHDEGFFGNFPWARSAAYEQGWDAANDE